MVCLFRAATTADGRLDYPSYLKLHGGLFRALRLEWTAAEAQARAQSDWLADSSGAPHVPVDRFRASLRMLAQRWTGSEPSEKPLSREAVLFLVKLVRCLTQPSIDASGAKVLKLRDWHDVPLGACVPESVVAALKAKPPARPSPSPGAEERRSPFRTGRGRRGRGGSFDAEMVARKLARAPYEDGTVHEVEASSGEDGPASGDASGEASGDSGEAQGRPPRALSVERTSSILLCGPSVPATPLSRSPENSARVLSRSGSAFFSPSTLSSGCATPASTIRGTKTVYNAGKATLIAPSVVLELSLPPTLSS
eukprot:tig00000808_g4404.t1